MLFTCSTLRSVHWRFLLAECYSELETIEGEMLAKRRERLVADEPMQITVSDQNCGCVAQTSSASVLRNATGFSNADLDTFRLLIDYAHENRSAESHLAMTLSFTIFTWRNVLFCELHAALWPEGFCAIL